MEEKFFDVVVVGAGAAGLMAAWELVQTGTHTAVIEARDYVGGRIHTIDDDSFELPVELGAEFVHGDLELTKLILKKAGVDTYDVKGEIWQNQQASLDEQSDFIEDYSALNKKFKEVKQDISVAEFFEKHLQGKEFEELRFSLKNYVEGYYAADINKASTFSLRDELTNSDDQQYRVEGGYIKLVDYLFQQTKQKGVEFFLSHPVKDIQWKKDEVHVVTGRGNFSARKILITVPIGVLQSELIQFSPAIAATIDASKNWASARLLKRFFNLMNHFGRIKIFQREKTWTN